MQINRYKQKNKLSCGPVVLKMTLSYCSKSVSERDIINGVGGLKKFGVRTVKLAEFARKLGFKVAYYSFNRQLADNRAVIKKPSIKDVKKFLKRKIPVILSVNSRILYNNLKQKITGHFIVITKYKNGIFWYNDPKDGRRHSIKEDDLIFAWHNNILDSSGYLLIIEK